MQLDGQMALWGALFFSFAVMLVIDFASRWQRRRSLEPDTLSQATIARDLAPKLDQVLTDRLTFYITGADGFPLTTQGFYPWWRGFIRRALRKGCTIHYILTEASQSDQLKLLRMKNELQLGTSGKVEFCFVSRSDVDDEDKQLVASLRTFHPLLVEGPDMRLMWIEGYHSPQSTIAYSCEFVPHAKAIDDPRYEKYKALLTHLIGKYGSSNAAAAA